jgi:hypothetical protein
MSNKTQAETEFLLNGVAFNADGECSHKPSARASWRRRLIIGVLLIETCFALPKLADGQFLSIFDSIFSSIQSDIGGSLSAINREFSASVRDAV